MMVTDFSALFSEGFVAGMTSLGVVALELIPGVLMHTILAVDLVLVIGSTAIGSCDTVADKQSLQMLQRLRENFLHKTKARFEFSWVKYTQNHTSEVIPTVFLVCQIFPGFDQLFSPLFRGR